jgi:hypothetical protein
MVPTSINQRLGGISRPEGAQNRAEMHLSADLEWSAERTTLSQMERESGGGARCDAPPAHDAALPIVRASQRAK